MGLNLGKIKWGRNLPTHTSFERTGRVWLFAVLPRRADEGSGSWVDAANRFVIFSVFFGLLATEGNAGLDFF